MGRSYTKMKRFMLAVLSLLLIFSSIPQATLAMDAANQEAHFANDFVQVSVQTKNGRFSIETKEGHPLKDKDNNKPLLFKQDVPDTSFTTFRINGNDYIYGNRYGFLGTNSQFIYHPASQGLTNQSVWRVEGLEIVQTLTLVNEKDNPNVGNVKISYHVTNQSNQTVELGSRILLDTMLGANDASPITLPGSEEYIRTEQVIAGDIPYYWRAVDNPTAPDIMSYGFLQGWGNQSPDRLVAAHWEGISRTKWDYEVNEHLDFTSTWNKYGSADSAVALYWDPAGLAPGEQQVFETYYGLGSFVTAFKEAKYATQLMAPKQLELNESRDGYVQEQFEIRLEIDNSVSRAEGLANVIAEIGLPLELELAEGEQTIQTVPFIDTNDMEAFVWRVKAKPQAQFKAAQYWVSVQADEGEEVVQSSFVVLPALSGARPEVQVLDVLPNKLYAHNSNHPLYIKGTGFEVLKGGWDVDVTLIRQQDQKSFNVTGLEVIDDKQMMLNLNEVFATEKPMPGLHTLVIDAGQHGTFTKTIELTMDKKYRSLSYGILVVVGEGEEGDEYSIHALENEEELKTIQQSGQRILVEIRGEITELQNDTGKFYEIEPGATINSVIQYKDNQLLQDRLNLRQKMFVEKKTTSSFLSGPKEIVEISGIGMLSLPAFPFMIGPFSLKLENGVYYSLDAREGEESIEIAWEPLEWLEIIQKISFFPVTIKYALLGDKSVSFKGSLSLNFSALNFGGKKEGDKKDDDKKDDDKKDDDKKEEDAAKKKDKKDPFKLSVNVDEARFGLNDNDIFTFLGLKAQGTVGLPKDLIPGVNFGAEAKVSIDTLDHIYEIEADVAFKVLEFYGLLTIRFTESSFPIIDNLVFAVGGEPGIPLIPVKSVAFITKGGGGFKNLYDTVTGNFNILPPLKLVVIGSLEIAKVVTARDMTLEASMRGIEFEGAFEIMKFDILKRVYGSFLVEDSLSKFAVAIKIGAELSIFDIITGDIKATISFDSSRSGVFGPVAMYGGGMVGLQIPKKVPVVGGKKLAEVEAGIGTENVYAQLRIIGIPVGVKYTWGEHQPVFTVGSIGTLSGLGESVGLMEQQLFDHAGNMQGTMIYGTNIRRVSRSQPAQLADLGSEHIAAALASATAQEHSIIIGEQDHALLEFQYHGQVPNLVITDPDGQTLQLEEDVNYLVQEIEADISDSGTLEQRIYVTIPAPKQGTWKVQSDTNIGYVLYDAAEPAQFSEVSVQPQSDLTYEVHWQTTGALGQEKVALHLAEDNETDSGRLLIGDLDVTTGTAEFTLPGSMPSGEYYVRADLSDNETLLHSQYSTTRIHIQNPHEPERPQYVQASSIGNGLVQVDWDMAQSPDGFMLQVLDESGAPLANIGEVEVEGEQREAIVGGAFLDESGELLGIQPGHTYQIALTAFNVVDEVKVFGSSAISGNTYVPEPQPARMEITIKDDGLQIREDVDENGNTVYVVNRDTVTLQMHADQMVELLLEVNEEVQDVLPLGQTWQQTITLQEGTNTIQVLMMNEQGDVSDIGITIISDTIAPDLKIESPDNAYLATDAIVFVKGVTEPGSTVMINGHVVQTAPDGQFETEIVMDGYLSQRISIIAEDRAGNRTEYEAFAANHLLDSFERVMIRVQPDVPEQSTMLLSAVERDQEVVRFPLNQPQVLELIGIDGEGHTYRIDPTHVQWDFLLGSERGMLTEDGTLHTKHEGDMVIRASYAISDEYSLEDTLIVQVEDVGSTPGGGSGNYDDWYVPNPEDPGPGEDPGEDPEEDDDSGVDDGTGHIQLPAVNPESTIDTILMKMLRSIIEAEDDVTFITSVPLSADQDTVIPLGNGGFLRVYRQAWDEEVGIGIGKVNDPSRYAFGSLHFVGDIYEFKTNQPITFDQPPLLSIRFALDVVDDPRKLGIYWFNEREQRWEYVGGNMNLAEGTMTAQLPHFSKYALIYNEAMNVFVDMANRWSRDIVYRLASIGIVSGLEQNGQFIFEPERSITRQEFAKLLTTASGTRIEDAGLPDMFADRNEVSTWALPYMAAALANKWITGTVIDGEWQLQPLRSITRAEAAVMVTRMLEDVLGARTITTAAFRDADQIPDWAIDAVTRLQQNGILNGYPDGTFRPNTTISREEGAAFIKNVIDLFE